MTTETKLILARFDDLKAHVDQRFEAIETKLDRQCDDCTFKPEAKGEFKTQWMNIAALWLCLVAFFGAFFEHIKK
jgi:hypothetical protein